METTVLSAAVAEERGASAVHGADAQIEALVKLLPHLARIFKAHWRGLTLTAPQMGMLMALQDLTERQGGANPGELAERFCLSSPAVTAALDELVEKGYCVRSHSEKDRRKVVVRTTPAGTAMLAAVQEGAVQSMRAMLADWDGARLDRLLAALRDLDQASEAFVTRGK
jgi:DNA-binding MarR family transcriptional regulator